MGDRPLRSTGEQPPTTAATAQQQQQLEDQDEADEDLRDLDGEEMELILQLKKLRQKKLRLRVKLAVIRGLQSCHDSCRTARLDLTAVEGFAQTVAPFLEDSLRTYRHSKEELFSIEDGILYKLLQCVHSEIARVIQDKADLTMKVAIQNIIKAVQEGSSGVGDLFGGVWDLFGRLACWLVGWLVGGLAHTKSF